MPQPLRADEIDHDCGKDCTHRSHFPQMSDAEYADFLERERQYWGKEGEPGPPGERGVKGVAAPKTLSQATIKCLESLVDQLEDLHDCLDRDGLSDNLRSLVDQAIQQIQLPENRVYRIVRVGTER